MDQVLAWGPIPLTEATVDRVCAFFEWALDVRMRPADRALARDEMIRDWTIGNVVSITAFRQMEMAWAQVEPLDQATRLVARESNQPGLVAGLRTDGSALARVLIDAYDLANAPLAPGDPPLTHEMAESYLERLAFIVGIVRGGTTAIPLSDAEREAWIGQLVSAYPQLDPRQRWEVVNAPLNWAVLKAQWASSPPAQREIARAAWRQFFPAETTPAPWSPAVWSSAAPAPFQPPAPYQPQVPESPAAEPMSSEDVHEAMRASARHASLVTSGLQMSHTQFMYGTYGKSY